MEIVNKKLSLEEFKKHVSSFDFSPLNPDKLVIHHTWKPTVEQWQGQKSINGLKSFYEGKEWSTGPHLFVAEDGIWLFTPMNQTGTHAGSGNYRSIGIEIVGDYNDKVWEGKTKLNAVGAIKCLTEKLGAAITFHRDFSSKTCPGSAITKEWLTEVLKNELTEKQREYLSELEAILEQRLDKAWDQIIREVNPLAKQISEIKGVPVTSFKIVSEKL